MASNFNNMKLTATGYRITKNGNIMHSIEKEAFKSEKYLGNMTKKEGVYYFFNRKQGSIFVYLPRIYV
jgi:hypothetical protein